MGEMQRDLAYILGSIEGKVKVYELGLVTPEKAMESIIETLKTWRNEQAKMKAS